MNLTQRRIEPYGNIAKLLLNNESIASLAKETQVNQQTLRNWRNQARQAGITAPVHIQ
ncbi:MAG: helix-turn-helix domain-containing protein [Parabacteroides sp.]|nr:helix-turn-helix domain-containing protein [Eubacteriales bacterium]MDD4592986.1 helix-turn-helix domain-containing protein [Parabacteroides sp.]